MSVAGSLEISDHRQSQRLVAALVRKTRSVRVLAFARSARRTEALLLIVLLACYGYFFPRWGDWNQNSRFDLVMAIVDGHTFQIDDYVANTGDYAAYNDHTYSDKAPGLALLGVPVYAVVRYVVPPSLVVPHLGEIAADGAFAATLRTDGGGLAADRLYTFIALAVTTFVTVAIPSAALALLFFWVAGALGWNSRHRLIATLAFALGTIAFPYANAFVGHQTVAFLVFAAFVLLFGIRTGRLQRAWLYPVGSLLGYSLITEYPTGLIVGVLGLYALFSIRQPVGTAARLVAGGIPALLLLFWYDMAAFGTPLPIGYFHSALWADVHDTGFVSLTYPHLDALWGITFGVHRGVFFLSPFLLFAVPGYNRLWQDTKHRAEFWVLLVVPAVFLLFNASSAMWQGGFSVGPRYIIACLPFLGLAAGAGLHATWKTAALRPIVVAAVVWSVVAVWAETIAGQSFPDYTPNPLFDLSLPLLAQSDIARNAGMVLRLYGWSSLVPLAVLAVVAVAAGSVSNLSRPLESTAKLAGSPAGAATR